MTGTQAWLPLLSLILPPPPPCALGLGALEVEEAAGEQIKGGYVETQAEPPSCRAAANSMWPMGLEVHIGECRRRASKQEGGQVRAQVWPPACLLISPLPSPCTPRPWERTKRWQRQPSEGGEKLGLSSDPAFPTSLGCCLQGVRSPRRTELFRPW